MTIAGATRVAAVIGDPVRHSLSPVLHNAAYRDLGLDWVYVAKSRVLKRLWQEVQELADDSVLAAALGR